MENVKFHLGMLGLRVKDKVTGFKGVVTSVGFDLYGCVQCTVHPGLDEKGEPKDGRWFDSNRLEVLDGARVMPVPAFDYGPAEIARGDKGPAEKPANDRW